jgi:hypothetical protein
VNSSVNIRYGLLAFYQVVALMRNMGDEALMDRFFRFRILVDAETGRRGDAEKDFGTEK